MEIKGDFIVKGSYIDIHDNEVVNLSVDKAQVKIGENGNTGNELDDLPSSFLCFPLLIPKKRIASPKTFCQKGREILRRKRFFCIFAIRKAFVIKT